MKSGAARENPNLTAGSMAKSKESKLLNFDITHPLDIEYALRGMKGNKALYFSILSRFIASIHKKEMK